MQYRRRPLISEYTTVISMKRILLYYLNQGFIFNKGACVLYSPFHFTYYIGLLFFSVAQQYICGQGRPVVEVSRSHNVKHTHSVGHLCESDQHVAEAATYVTQQTQEDIHPLSGTRTRDARNQATADLRLRPHDQRDRLCFVKRREC